MILSVNNLTKSFGDNVLFSDLSFSLEKSDKLCIVGRNGCGKSTLLKLILNKLQSDNGKIINFAERTSYLSQEIKLSGNRSEGEKTRAELNRVFEEKPKLLLLDEPTNHLDIKTIEWLEDKLKSYKGALILVSHDRFLIDKVATHILDLNTTPAKKYKGNFTDFLNQKELILKTKQREQKNYEDRIRHEKEVIDKLKSFNRQKSIKRAESREKLLNKIKGPDSFLDQKTDINLVFSPEVISGNDVLYVESLSKAYDKSLFKDINIDIKRGEHIGLIGSNGCGKSTIFKIIMGDEKADDGHIKTGTNVSIGYYDQKLTGLNNEKSVYDEISDEHKTMSKTAVMNTLAAFSFYDNDVNKKVASLSGGEKGRLSICKLMLSKANFLLLDEPTNHLDMESREILEDAINAYDGTVLFISHDRYFLNKCSDRILEIHDCNILNYLGNYEDYLLKKNDLINRGFITEDSFYKPKKPKEIKASRVSWEDKKANKALQDKKKRDEKNIINEIENTEKEIQSIEEKESLPENMSNHIKLNELMQSKNLLYNKLDELYERLETII